MIRCFAFKAVRSTSISSHCFRLIMVNNQRTKSSKLLIQLQFALHTLYCQETYNYPINTSCENLLIIFLLIPHLIYHNHIICMLHRCHIIIIIILCAHLSNLFPLQSQLGDSYLLIYKLQTIDCPLE